MKTPIHLALLCAALLCACKPEQKPFVPQPTQITTQPQTTAPSWLKGQLHLHSNRSGDSNTPPEDVVRWYAAHGYDFIVFTDHNAPHSPPHHPTMLTFTGVEWTSNLSACDPPPETRAGCVLHVNGLFLNAPRPASWPSPKNGDTRADVYESAIRATNALDGIAMLNHPNFHYAADGDLITLLAKRGLVLMEVANEAIDSNNEGDAAHPSTEALWDHVLSAGGHVYGAATDDAHHYYDADVARAHGELAYTGDRGFVMVRAERDRASIMGALRRGDFYSSNGLVLGDVRVEDKTLFIEAGKDSAPLTAEFIGQGGKALQATSRGTRFTFDLRKAPPGYVRARVSNGEGRTAWTQPVFGD